MEWSNQIGWADIIGYVIGVASLVFSILAVVGVKQIQKKYLLAGSLPEIIDQLVNSKEELVKLITIYYDQNQSNSGIFDDLNSCLSDIKPFLTNLNNYKLKGSENKDSQELIELVDKIIEADSSSHNIENYKKVKNKLITFIGNLIFYLYYCLE